MEWCSLFCLQNRWAWEADDKKWLIFDSLWQRKLEIIKYFRFSFHCSLSLCKNQVYGGSEPSCIHDVWNYLKWCLCRSCLILGHFEICSLFRLTFFFKVHIKKASMSCNAQTWTATNRSWVTWEGASYWTCSATSTDAFFFKHWHKHLEKKLGSITLG